MDKQRGSFTYTLIILVTIAVLLVTSGGAAVGGLIGYTVASY